MILDKLPDLPVKTVLPELLKSLENNPRLVLEAPPGAGKTTLVPLALLQSNWLGKGKIIMLEPRRLAAKAAAQRMADLLSEKPGQTVGYRVRMEKAVSAETKIEVVTEGILTRMLQDDPTLENVSAILFDEFHERSLQADLSLALALDAQNVLRPDLRLVLMSATLDAAFIGDWLEAPVITSAGRQFPIETHYLLPAEVAAAGNQPAKRLTELVPKAIRKALKEHPEGDILVFLPGLGEMRRVSEMLQNSLPENTDLHLLHGELTLQQQQAAIKPAPAGRRKVVLATSIAETSLTLEGVRMVIDGGFARVPKFMPRTGLTTLVTVPVSQAAADQRRGRAGRLGPGICYRLWSAADQLQLPTQLSPEICEADLSNVALELAVWGVKNIMDLKWLDVPPAAALAQARDLLFRLEAISENNQPTAHGRALARLGLNPRLGHLVMRGHEQNLGATACALASLLAERDILKSVSAERSEPNPDLHLRLEILSGKRPHTPGFQTDENALRRIKDQAGQLKQRLGEKQNTLDPDAAGLLTALAYPERIAQREHSGLVRLATGQKARLATELFSEAEFYGIAHLETGQQPRVLLAAPLSKTELLQHFAAQTEKIQEIKWEANAERIVARQITRLGALILEENTLSKPDPDKMAEVLLGVIREKGLARLPWSEKAIKTRQRLAFLHHLDPENWPDLSEAFLTSELENWLLPHLTGLRSWNDVSRLDFNELLLTELSWERRTEMDRLAPTHLEVPTGSNIPLDYTKPEAPVLAVRLQEVFGMLETPKIGGGKVPLLMHLLSPAHRPVQVTKDLRSFWNSGYFEVRKDLRGRYPKHHWPEDPLKADPVRGVKRKPK
ncbi:ATP-dependent helicase HrpB [Adhaeribacter sp. BT258]|uniref:ATP-dependent helicase HrpB n=1 Tax=Adhaeribacter terrigena TaxID=2793070 RepID=A0ABS1BZA7_9BACT|nr:ATP-dependent helicase HrpB [Adhaeribacter terrigena]MBK0402459.1 ATP-dependent helicase HrpB [Adhaeribacter terrigena]